LVGKLNQTFNIFVVLLFGAVFSEIVRQQLVGDETDDGSVEFTFFSRAWVFAGVVIEAGLLYGDVSSQNPQFTDDILLLLR
jgi:hypothetical protein